jgi:hypothetical protein
MGNIVTPKYRLICSGMTPSAWNCTTDGPPTQKSLEKWVRTYAKSLEHGGANEHVSKALGHVPYPTMARIETNVPHGERPRIMAEWKAAPFQLLR